MKNKKVVAAKKMGMKEALEVLGDGHTIISVDRARRVCETVGVEFLPAALVQKWASNQSSDNPKGLSMRPGYENTEGVYTLTLSYYVARKLGVAEKSRAGMLSGRGSQAMANAEVIAEALGVRS